jgi:ABC-2 type transport system ATP-binding protein
MNELPNKIIRVTNLIKKYENLVAVNKISFDVYEGEIFGLLGPNGAGKTTTLEIMETLREADSGDVSIAGYSIHDNKNEIKSTIGVQLQQSGYYPNLNLRELIELFSGLYGKHSDPDEILGLVDLKEKAKSTYKKLSGGQKQRFSIATTLINEPKIIFLDEPSTGLDPQARRKLWELIKQIRNRGTTVMLTTHYMDEAEYLCGRVGIMDSGKIIALDNPHKLIDDLISTGFKRQINLKEANLEDVFLSLTGKELRDE